MYTVKFIQQFFRFFARNAKFLPGSFAGLYIIVNFIVDIVRGDVQVAFARLAKTLFAAEYVINQNVHLAVANSPQYGMGEFVQIVVSLMVMYIFIKWVSKVMTLSFGANKNFGAYFWAAVLLFVIEASSARIIDGTFGFIPLWDGVVFLFIHISPVLSNVFGSSAPVVGSVLNSTLNSTANTTITNITT